MPPKQTTIAVDKETHAKAKRLMHRLELASIGAAVDLAVDRALNSEKGSA